MEPLVSTESHGETNMEGDNSVASLDPYSLTPAMVNFIAVTPKPGFKF